MQSLLAAPLPVLPSSSQGNGTLNVLANHMVTQNKDEFPSFLSSKERAYQCVVIGLRAKVMCILVCELRDCNLPSSCFPECGCGVLCLGPSGQEHQARGGSASSEKEPGTMTSNSPALLTSRGVYQDRKDTYLI